MTQYARGANFERRVVKELTAAGYYAMRSAGSRGKVDVVAVWQTWRSRHIYFTPEMTMFVQCKLKGVLPNKDRRELCRVARECSCLPILASRENGKVVYRVVRPRAKQDEWKVLDVG